MNASPPRQTAEGGFFMSQLQTSLAQTAQVPDGGARALSDLAFDLTIMEAGLRLKVLPLRDAILRGRKLSFSEVERDARRVALFALCENAPLSIVDVSLFADAIARRPDLAGRLWCALHASARR